jgi:hypothetical protein
MEQFNGFMRSHVMPPPGECSRSIGPADAMVVVVVVVVVVVIVVIVVTKTQHTTNF